MHKVTRLDEPQSLRDNKQTWTTELLEQIRVLGSYTEVPDTYKNRYKKDDIKESLERMYKGLCCFCESSIGVASFERIEHLKPKSLPQFYHLSFEWTNLNLSCEICNNNKKDHWDERHPILDPCIDNPQEHLKFVFDMVESITDRGRTTIVHTDLNRYALVEARSKILSKIMRIIDKIKAEGDNHKKQYFYNELKNLSIDKEPYCSFIKHLADSYLEPNWNV